MHGEKSILYIVVAKYKEYGEVTEEGLGVGIEGELLLYSQSNHGFVVIWQEMHDLKGGSQYFSSKSIYLCGLQWVVTS